MNTTFTTYAEKKAKQFLNLLQGYTKGIRMTAILILLLMGVSNAWAYDISAGSHIYLVNTGNWSGCQLYIWKSDYNTYYTFSKITNTNIYHYHFANSWNGYAGVKFRSDVNWSKQSSGDITQDLSSCYFVGTGTTKYTTLANMNRAAKVVSMVSTGGNYTEQANSACIATVSGYNLAANASSTTEVNASTGSASNASINAAYGSTITYTATAGTGYTFDGFSTTNSTSLPNSPSASGKTATASGYGSTNNTTYYAYFKLNQYTITYNLNGGSGTMTPTTYTIETATFNLPTPTKAGCTFEGWYTTSNFSGSKVTQITKGSTGNKTFYAKWTANANTHNITYTAQGTGWTYSNSNPTTAEEDATVTFVVNPTAGYSVSVSSDGPALTGPNANNQYTFTMPNKDVKITVEAEPEQYTVTLNKQSGTGGTSSVTATYADAMPTITAPTRTGYTFNGYFDATSGGTKYYNANGSSAKNWDKTSNTTLYAQWTANKYSVKFNANGGSGSMSNQSFTYDVPQQLTPNAFTRSGYTFIGWAKSSSGNVVYTNRQLVNNLTTNNNSTVNIYAIWEEKTANTVYLKPSDEWKNDNARFAVYYWKDSENGWVDMEDVGCTGEYFKADIPVKYTDIIFCRMNPNATEYKFEDGIVWNKTGDLKVPNDDKVLYNMTLTDNTYLYLKPNDNWKKDGAKFEVYYNTSGNYIYMDDIGDGIYRCQKQSGKFTFRRKDPNNGYSEPWSVTNEMTVPTDGTNLYTIADDAWSNGNGTWSTFSTSGWTTYTEPNITIKLVKTTNGTITLGTTTSGNSDKTFTTSINSTYVLNVAPSDGYVLASCRITMGNNSAIEGIGGDTYTFCGNATITAEFAKPVGLTEQRVHGGELVNYNQNNGWVGGNGTKANPYTLYSDEAVRITVTALPTVSGKTAYYKFGLNEEQTENVFDWKDIDGSTATNLRVTAYYKDANGNISDEHLGVTAYYKFIPLPFYLMTDPNKEINIEDIVAGDDILVQFRSETKATVSLYVKKDNEADSLLTDISNTDAYDHTYDVPNDIGLCVLHFIARASTPVHGRTFEIDADVAIYKNVIIKVNDTEGWVKDVYLWRDGSGDVLTSWPGNPVLQNFGTWRVFSVKYPYYDKFIINDGNNFDGGGKQTENYDVPNRNMCYTLSEDRNAMGKYELEETDCPPDLIVSDIDDVTISVGEEKVIMPEIFVGLGHQLSDVTMEIKTTDSESKYVRLLASGTNIILIGKAVGTFEVTVTYTLGGLTVEKTFEVEITSSNTLTITVKVPRQNGDGSFQIGWENTEDIKIYYEAYGLSTASIPMNYLGTFDDYYYMQAQVPFGNGPDIDFVVYWQDRNSWWKKSKKVENVKTDGCYVISQGTENDARSITLEANGCKFYQVKVRMQNGKTYQSNVGFAATDILSFFAPGANEVGRNAGAVIVYENNKAVKLIEPGKFETSDVYTASVNEDDYTLTNIAPYTGNFYIRTWGTDGDISNKGWNSVQDWTDGEKASRTFTEFVSREGEFYNHYWVQAMNSGGYNGKDVSACVANDYNDDLAGKLLQDKNTTETGDIKLGGTGKTINVRFGYDPRTNYFARAVLQGSNYENYLNLHCDNAYADKECTKKLPYGDHNNITENKFRDISSWVYERDIYVNITNSTPSASVYVEGRSPHVGEDGKAVVYNHLLGYVTNEITGEESTTPIQKTVIGSGTDNGVYKVRVVYDFKTNRIIAVWEIATNLTITTDKTVNADVLFIRKENGDVPQITLSDNGEINNLKSLFFAMELDRGSTNKDERHEEQYMFTLPFDCVVGSISGVHGYMELWGIQRYRGDLRAQKGWYAETATFWEWMSPKDTLKAGEGYLLAFDKKNAPWNEIEVDKTDANGNIIEGQKETISMLRLYFPSIGSGFDLQQQSTQQLTVTYPNHPCTLTLHNRYLQDSNWKMIGTTSYNNATVKECDKDNDPEYKELTEAPSFRYQYSYTFDNNNNRTNYNYTPEDGKTATYKSFYGYMVQFAGTITWNPINETVPEPLAAPRRAQAERSSVTMRLELANTEGEKQDQTFVALDEDGTTTFDQNKDLNKVFNSDKPNIYTLSEGIPFAGNTLPMEEVIVPVGVKIDAEGEYTFRMPDGTEGMVVELIDYETNTRTNLLLDDYTITLSAGSYENRFALHIQPQKDVTTGVGNVGDEAKGIEKYLIDGKLIIRTAEGAVYDAQGHRL